MGLFTDKSGKWIGFTDRMKYVEDFRTELIEKENGKIVKKVTYLVEWTVLNDTGARTLWKLISAAVSAVLTGGFLAWGLLTTHASSGSFLVVIPLVMALFPSICCSARLRFRIGGIRCGAIRSCTGSRVCSAPRSRSSFLRERRS